MKPMFDRDKDAAARTAWMENRGGGEVGMHSVVNVIINRANIGQAYAAAHGKPHPLFGDGTVYAVCHAPLQFSCWNADDPNLHKGLDVDCNDPEFAIALELVDLASLGNLPDITDGATSYYALSMPHAPYWAEDHAPTAVLAGQAFFKGV